MQISRLRQSLAARKLKKFLFSLSGHDPGSRWYGGYRLGELMKSLDRPFREDQIPAGYGRWLDERLVEYPWLFSRLPDGPGNLLDAGSILNHDFVVSHPKLRAKNLTIVTLAPETECYWQKGISYVYGDLRSMVFRDSIFDYVICVSTLDHVGLDNQRFHDALLRQGSQDGGSYLMAVRELARVLKPGGTCFISVPYGKQAVIQQWQQVFDAAMIQDLLSEFAPKSSCITYFRYSEQAGWQLSNATEASDARYFDTETEHPWPGHPAAAEAVVCMELRK